MRRRKRKSIDLADNVKSKVGAATGSFTEKAKAATSDFLEKAAEKAQNLADKLKQ